MHPGGFPLFLRGKILTFFQIWAYFPAVSDFSVNFSCRMRFHSSLLKRRWLTAAYSFMKALALPWLVGTVRPLCSRCPADIVEEGVPGSDLIVHHVRVGSGLFSRPVRNSSHFYQGIATLIGSLLRNRATVCGDARKLYQMQAGRSG